MRTVGLMISVVLYPRYHDTYRRYQL